MLRPRAQSLRVVSAKNFSQKKTSFFRLFHSSFYNNHGGIELFLFPSVRRLLAENQLDPKTIKTTGKGGRLTKADVLFHLKTKGSPETKRLTDPQTSVTEAKKPSVAPQVHSKPTQSFQFLDIENSNMRRVIARRLTESKTKIPHQYLTRYCNIDNLLNLRKKLIESYNTKLSVNDFIIKSVALALNEVPEANVILDPATQNVSRCKTIDISVAVAIEGGLITPIIKNANLKGLVRIGEEMKDLATRARANQLKPEEFQGGSFTISNLGMFGITEFSAVINPPQCGIMAVGGSIEKIEWDETKNSPKVSNLMSVTISSDARALDNEVVAKFCDSFSSYLFEPQRLIL